MPLLKENIIDSHCHLDFPDFDPDRDQIIQQGRALGINELVIPAVAWQYFPRVNAICSTYEGLYPAYGLHPFFLSEHKVDHIAQLETWLQQHPAIAVGEIGLDFFDKGLDREKQQELFEQQLVLAQTMALPVILHVRKAHDPVLACVKRVGFKQGGIVHAFNGSMAQAMQFYDLGFKLGFGGTLTFTGSKKIRQLFKALPLQALVLETDSPDMATAENRGNRNNPLFLKEIIESALLLRKESRAEFLDSIYTNTTEVLRLNQ